MIKFWKLKPLLITGTPQRLTANGWILATLLVLALNAYQLMLFLSPEMVGKTPIMRFADQKRHALEKQRQERGAASDSAAFERIPQLFAPEHKKVEEAQAAQEATATEAASSQPEAVAPRKEKVVPPRLTGILSYTGINQSESYAILMEGKCLKVADSIKGFLIQKITPEGVTLTKEGALFWVPAPYVYYSISQDVSSSNATTQEPADEE